jgi:hypothetical protein
MVQLASTTRRTGRRTLFSSVIAALIVVLTATSASASGPGHYEKFISNNGHFLTLSRNNFVLDETSNDDEVYYLSTSGTGINRLPFQLGLYNQWYRNIAISTNGNIQLGVTPDNGNTAYENECLRSTTITGPTVFPYWDDLLFHPEDTTSPYPQGVFVQTFGHAPNRAFVVSWQGVLYEDESVPVKVQAIFRERSQNVTVVYGSELSASPDASSPTIGVQSGPRINRKTQYVCDTDDTDPPQVYVHNGTKLVFVHDD